MSSQASGNRIRARHTGLVSPLTRRPVFRIEDSTGQVLRRIGTARNMAEAVAHYWRATGCDGRLGVTMAEPPSDAALRRRIDGARSARSRGPAVREAMQTHELPLSLPVEQHVAPAEAETALPAAPAGRKSGGTARRRELRPKPDAADLFGVPEAVAGEEAAAPVDAAPEHAPDAMPERGPEPGSVPEPEPEPGPPVKAMPEPVALPEPVPEPEPDARTAPQAPYHLDPQTVLLQQVDHRNLRPTDRSDSYLYHVTNRTDATSALQGGLVVSAHDPVILTERQGVAYWLSVLAEDYDVILDGPADFVVLRMRRFAIGSLLEPDPDASRSAGCPCYLLTGGPRLDE